MDPCGNAICALIPVFGEVLGLSGVGMTGANGYSGGMLSGSNSGALGMQGVWWVSLGQLPVFGFGLIGIRSIGGGRFGGYSPTFGLGM